MDILTILIVGTLCIACFYIGAKVGQTVAKGERVELPSINPAKAISEHKARKADDKKQSRMETILQNIEAYDGTGNGQRDVL